MFVVLRKFPEDENWSICGAFSEEPFANAEIHKQESSGRKAKMFRASHVWVAENGQHTWTA